MRGSSSPSQDAERGHEVFGRGDGLSAECRDAVSIGDLSHAKSQEADGHNLDLVGKGQEPDTEGSPSLDDPRPGEGSTGGRHHALAQSGTGRDWSSPARDRRAGAGSPDSGRRSEDRVGGDRRERLASRRGEIRVVTQRLDERGVRLAAEEITKQPSARSRGHREDAETKVDHIDGSAVVGGSNGAGHSPGATSVPTTRPSTPELHPRERGSLVERASAPSALRPEACRNERGVGPTGVPRRRGPL
jgi:hypothetical protein